jgi:asparaginyl-tRNA synthetase
MSLVPVDDVLKQKEGALVGAVLQVGGWVRTRRDSKAGLSFIALTDGTCFDTLQLVAKNDLPNYADILKLTSGCSVLATGVVIASQGKGQSVELEVQSLEVVGWVDDPDTYPISQKRHTFEYLREVAHLRARTNTFGAVARVRNCLAQAIHRFFSKRGYSWIHTPIITASDAEGAGQMFRVSTLDFLHAQQKLDIGEDFFGKEAFLTVSGQLNVETYCMALSKVYTFGPTFRAENSNTTRHLAEFWMIEPEIAFCDLPMLAGVAEEFLKEVIEAALVERGDDMKFFEERIQPGLLARLRHVIDTPFRRIDYGDAVDVLNNSGKSFEFPVKWGIDLQTEHERYLTEEAFKQPVVVMNYPKDIKAFYMRQNPDGRTVAAMDVLAAGIGEIIGGSQREERLERLDARLDELKLPREAYWWYRDLRRYGTVPHAGFGLGFERLVMFVTGMANIRDVIPFPRTPKNAAF